MTHSAPSPIPPQLLRIVYASQATALIDAETVHAILLASRKNNPQRSITGLLYCSGNVFVQFLEGPEAAIMSMYLRLLEDPRHNNINLLSTELCSDRLFADWDMAYATDVDGLTVDFEKLLRLRGESDFGYIAEQCLTVLNAVG
jgi:hypothetical protein